MEAGQREKGLSGQMEEPLLRAAPGLAQLPSPSFLPSWA